MLTDGIADTIELTFQPSIESAPFDNSSLRSVYHVRNVDIYRMKCLSKSKSRVDIIASHDWPLGIEQHGNTQALIRQKPFFRQEIEQNNLGSPPNREVLDALKPRWWFSAHLHVKFVAKVDHQRKVENVAAKGDEDAAAHLIPSQIKLKKVASPAMHDSKVTVEEQGDDSTAVDEEGNGSGSMEASTLGSQENGSKEHTIFHGLESTCDAVNDLAEQMTRFLALDKCLPRRKYLSILHIEGADRARESTALEFDPEWLAVLRKTHHMNSVQQKMVRLPDDIVEICKEDIEWVEERLKEKNSKNCPESSLTYRNIPTDFLPTVPFYSDPMFQSRSMGPPFSTMGNPQTDFLLDILELNHKLTHPYDRSLTPQKISENLRGNSEPPFRHSAVGDVADENEIDLDPQFDNEKEEVDENEIEIDADHDQAEQPTHVIPAQVSPAENAIAKKPRIDV